MTDFDNIKTWYFDCDGVLYDDLEGVFGQVSKRMTEYISQKLDLSLEKAKELVDLAKRAGSVSHDGESVYGAQVVAAMEAMAFIEKDIKKSNEIFFDSIISPSALNHNFYNEIKSLSRFWWGNPEPKFVIENLELIKSTIVGDKHIKSILVGQDGSVVKSVTFNAVSTNLESYLLANNRKKINIFGKLSLNEWKGKKNVEFIIDDISVNKTIKNLVPSSNG